MSKKYTYEEVKEFIDRLGYELISKKYVNNHTRLQLKDINGYIVFSSFHNLKNGQIPNKFHKKNPHTIQNIQLWCKLNRKPFELIDGQIYEGNNKNLKWKCLKEECEEIFETIWNSIHNDTGCPYCAGQKISLSNCLATKNPALAKEWHPTKNGDLTPFDVTCGNSNIEIWWQCLKNPKHIWKTFISNRSNGNGCPYCIGRFPSEDYNLLIINPELCKEWNYNKNDKTPTDYSPNANRSVWWKCLECEHEWEALISSRNNLNSGCPECNKSKGEKECKRVFDLRNTYYIQQKTFDGLLGLGDGLLSYDFYLPKYNLLIEYQGIQHEKYIPGFHKSIEDFEKQVEHDRRKKEYTERNEYNFLEIWYKEFDNIEKVLSKFLV